MAGEIHQPGEPETNRSLLRQTPETTEAGSALRQIRSGVTGVQDIGGDGSVTTGNRHDDSGQLRHQFSTTVP
jgi:hypothetical protein